jgi:hypothetical protein
MEDPLKILHPKPGDHTATVQSREYDIQDDPIGLGGRYTPDPMGQASKSNGTSVGWR